MTTDEPVKEHWTDWKPRITLLPPSLNQKVNNHLGRKPFSEWVRSLIQKELDAIDPQLNPTKK